MPNYALLARESSNRVYATNAPRLLAAELAAIGPHLQNGVSSVEQQQLGNVPYVTFASGALTRTDRFILSNLSGVRAVFELSGDSLTPVELDRLAWFDDDLVTIQRYSGKTNEQFTHLLLNLTLAESRCAHVRSEAGETIHMLDPVAGRGSSLNRALLYGFDAAGIEVNDADVDQYRNFITTYLKDHRIKHKLTHERFRKGELSGCSAFEVDIRGVQSVRMSRGSSTQTKALAMGQRYDVIIGDLPYGVQHKAAGAKSTARSPEDLVAESIDAWRKVLRHEGALGLSWNLKTLSRDALVSRVEAAGLTVVSHPHPFEHTVDRAITRDLLVATI